MFELSREAEMTEIKGRKNPDPMKRARRARMRDERRATARAEAEERNAFWRSLSPAMQLASLDARLGRGLGARKQRARILKAKAA